MRSLLASLLLSRAAGGEELRLRGPLGLAAQGLDVQLAHRVRFRPEGEGTRVTVSVCGTGEVSAGIPEAVRGAWHHFLVERFRPHVAGTLGRQCHGFAGGGPGGADPRCNGACSPEPTTDPSCEAPSRS